MDRMPDNAAFDAAWRKLRDEITARVEARYGVAFDREHGDDADPEILADLALERALSTF